MPEPIYTVTHIIKTYPNQLAPANDDICLEIYPGEIFGLLGDNGAGKSTLVRQMANLLTPTSGRITLFGQEVGREPLHAPLHIGYMPQDRLALNNLTIGEALYFTAHLRGLSRSDARKECTRLFDLWQIGGLRHKTSRQLSGGQKRLMQIAVCMAASPPVLILDEPTNDLDPLRRKQVWDTLRDENRQRGTTIIFITHDAIEAEKIIQRVGILHAGKLVALGKPADLKSQVDRQLRLELFFSPDAPPNLPASLQPHAVAPGRWLVYLDRPDAGVLLNSLDLTQVDDFRLYSATLEDLYLHYVHHVETPTDRHPTP
jgi:ABC-type multidrug transport system ATPase subunit